jgi:protein required for attachment to host cells
VSAAGRDEYRQLVVVAAPAFLGELRKHVPAHFAERIVLEILKDMLGAGTDKLARLLSQEL